MTTVNNIWLSVFIVVLLLTGCSSKPIEVAPSLSFPTALVQPLPVHLAVYYPDEFSQYLFENVPDKKKKKKKTSKSSSNKPAKPVSSSSRSKQPSGKGLRLALGAVQTPLFTKLLSVQFESLSVAVDQSLANADLLVVPEVADFQYSTPRITKLKIYEVWIKYRLRFYDADKQLAFQWVLPVYGKTPTAFMKSDVKAFEAATEVALRDLSAALISDLPRQSGFQRWRKQGE